MRPMHRRDFLKAGAAGVILFPNTGLGRFAPTPVSQTARIALVKTGDRKHGVAQALKLLDLTPVAGKRVVLKPNFNTADPTPGSTHNDTLTQLVYELHERGARSVTLGESSGPPDTQEVMERKGTFDLARDHGFEVVNYDRIPDDDWVHFGPGGTHWPEGFWLPRHVVEAEYNVSTCCLKTHQYGGIFTMSLKLSVGLTPEPTRRGMHRSPDMRRMIAELNTGYRPQLIVLDGVDAFTDGGPSRGRLARADVIIAGHDRVAIDAVGLAVLKDLGSNDAIMHTPIFQQEQMARAVELGLGVTAGDQIELVTGDPASAEYARRLRGVLAAA